MIDAPLTTGGIDPVDAATAYHALAREFTPADRTLPNLLNRRRAAYRDKPLLVIGGRRYCCDDLIARAGCTAALLQAAGIGAGDRVAILCGNRIEFIDLFIACAWRNAVAVPINLSSRGGQLQHILQNSGAKLLVIDADAVSALDQVDPNATMIEDVWLLAGDWGEAVPVDRWRARAMPAMPEQGIPPAPIEPSDTGAILYTSGTTGPSKGVCCPHAQFFWWGVNTIDILEIVRADVLLTTLPLFHVNALNAFFQALLSGATLVVEPRFSASGFLTTVRDHRATVTYLLGAMVPILLARPPSPEDNAHHVRCALAPAVPVSAAAQFEARYGIGLVEGYGSTETNFVIGARLADQQPGTMGCARPGYEVGVVDTEDRKVADGRLGELVVRTHIPFSMATGYHGSPEATASAWRGGWFHTGDRGWRDADGRFHFVDRIKDSIRRRGENVSAFEVEEVLLAHPAVANAAVYAVASDLAEDEVMAAIVLAPGAHVNGADLLDFCQPRMTYFSVPRFLRFVPALPLAENGKIQKFALREEGVTADTWDREAAGYIVARPRGGTVA